MKNLMKNSMLMVVALILAVPNAYAVRGQASTSAATELAARRAAKAQVAASEIKPVKTTPAVSSTPKVEATSTDSFATRVKKVFTRAPQAEPKAENKAPEQSKQNNEQAKSTSTSSTAPAQDAPAPVAASLKSKIYNKATVAAQGAKNATLVFARDAFHQMTGGEFMEQARPEASAESAAQPAPAQGVKSFVAEAAGAFFDTMTDGPYSQEDREALGKLIPDKWTAAALVVGLAAVALEYSYAPTLIDVDTYPYPMICQKAAADLCGACEPYVQAAVKSVGIRQGDFWGAVGNIFLQPAYRQ